MSCSVMVTRGSPQAIHGPQVRRVAGMLTTKCATQKSQPLSNRPRVQAAKRGAPGHEEEDAGHSGGKQADHAGAAERTVQIDDLDHLAQGLLEWHQEQE